MLGRLEKRAKKTMFERNNWFAKAMGKRELQRVQLSGLFDLNVLSGLRPAFSLPVNTCLPFHWLPAKIPF